MRFVISVFEIFVNMCNDVYMYAKFLIKTLFYISIGNNIYYIQYSTYLFLINLMYVDFFSLYLTMNNSIDATETNAYILYNHQFYYLKNVLIIPVADILSPLIPIRPRQQMSHHQLYSTIRVVLQSVQVLYDKKLEYLTYLANCND